MRVQVRDSTAARSWHGLLLPWSLLAAALAVHVWLMPNPGYERDLYWFGTWMRVAVERGVAEVSTTVPCDYPPGYLYLLEGVGLLWVWLTGLPLPADGTLALRVLVKTLPTLADLGTAWLLYRLALEYTSRRNALLVLAAFAFNPAILFNSAAWGQADSVVCLLLVIGARLALRGRFALGFAGITAAILVKLQAVVVAPVFLLAAARAGGRRTVFEGIRGSALTALALLAPFLWSGRMGTVLETIFSAPGRYPYLSLDAHNVWWLLWGPAARWTSDAMRVGNSLYTLRGLGTLLIVTASALVLWRFWSAPDRGDMGRGAALVEACALQSLAFYLFPTEMHERYVVTSLVFLAALCIWRPLLAWPLYLLTSIVTFLSLAGTLRVTYPANVEGLSVLLSPDRSETLWLSAAFLGVFVVLLFATPDRRFRRLGPMAALLVAGATTALFMLPRGGPARLSDWDPVLQSQEWGTPHRDESVDGHRLSVDGFVFRHGIGTHAHSVLTYHLNGAFRVFDTMLGIDDEANRGQRIRFRVLVDGRMRYDSGELSGHGPPEHVQLSVVGGKFLTLEVLDGGDGINSDHADWLEPRLWR